MKACLRESFCVDTSCEAFLRAQQVSANLDKSVRCKEITNYVLLAMAAKALGKLFVRCDSVTKVFGALRKLLLANLNR